MMWLFDTRREFLAQEYVSEIESMNHEYLLEFQRREKDENVTNRRKINPINKITGIWNLTKQLVDAIQSLRIGISYNSPIEIDEEGAITYEVVQNCIASKLNVAYVEKDSADENLIAIRGEKIITADMVDSNGEVKCIVHQSSS